MGCDNIEAWIHAWRPQGHTQLYAEQPYVRTLLLIFVSFTEPICASGKSATSTTFLVFPSNTQQLSISVTRFVPGVLLARLHSSIRARLSKILIHNDKYLKRNRCNSDSVKLCFMNKFPGQLYLKWATLVRPRTINALYPPTAITSLYRSQLINYIVHKREIHYISYER